jgi:hypothetical protein
MLEGFRRPEILVCAVVTLSNGLARPLKLPRGHSSHRLRLDHRPTSNYRLIILCRRLKLIPNPGEIQFP